MKRVVKILHVSQTASVSYRLICEIFTSSVWQTNFPRKHSTEKPANFVIGFMPITHLIGSRGRSKDF